MGKSDTASISTFECQSILDSIQNEYDHLQKEGNSLGKLQESLSDLIAQRNILAKRKSFNEKNCIVCCLTFNLLFKRKLICQNCHFWVCRSCAIWDQYFKQWFCHICEKQRILDSVSSDWICNRLKTEFGHFNTAKALRNYFYQKRISDCENDSGYGAAGDFVPLMKFLRFPPYNKDMKTDSSLRDGDCEEIEEEEELLEIQDSIETILEGLLGGNLEDAAVNQLYPTSPFYLNLFIEFHPKLVDVIEDLSKALQKALHNLPAENGITPTTAHAALKNVIANLVNECQDIPALETTSEEEENHLAFNYALVISSYESLVAAAVINKVVEESQTKFKTLALEAQPLQENSFNNVSMQDIKLADENQNAENEELFKNIKSSTSFDLPIKCVQIEEIEEITQEFTDSEDDKVSSISKYSNSLQNIDEIGMDKNSDLDIFFNINHSINDPTPFPEFGCDLVEDQEVEESLTPCHLVSVSSWEDNWLFKKKKRLPLYSNLKYQLLTYCDEPPSMLIPCPSECTDNLEPEELSSELSETLSTGTLDFSSDSESADKKELFLNFEDAPPSKVIRSYLSSSPFTEKVSCQQLTLCHTEHELNDKHSKSKIENIMELEGICSNINICEINDHVKNMDEKSYKQEETNTSIVETPPLPGSIAEREHKKWLNAVPLKHNPYSAENISKRYKKTGSQEQSTSFEEFERKLSISSDKNNSCINKVNCGPKSIDSDLYKRDYYINKGIEALECSYVLQNSSENQCSSSTDCFVQEEALNSFEEKVYVKSGKVFTLENHIRRLEREIKEDASLELPIKDYEYEKERNSSTSYNKQNPEKKYKHCRKVHSLTARSLSREFRNLAKQNLPKPMNRTIPVPILDDGLRENMCSPESIQSSLNTVQGDNGHGYTSDESNTSSNSTKPKTRRNISRSILKRATYWERRAEQGLLSDASVNEEFPPLETEE